MPLDGARGTVATGRAGRASSYSARDRGYPAAQVASPAAPEPSSPPPAPVPPPPRLPGSPALDRQAEVPDAAQSLRRLFPRVSGVPPTAANSEMPPGPLHLPGPRCRAASGYSPPRARRAAASLGSRPGSLDLLFPSEPPERLLGVEICCSVAYHPGSVGARAAWRSTRLRALGVGLRAPLSLDVEPGERLVKL